MTYTVDNNNSTLTPKQIMDTYRRAYQQVHKREPHISHQFAEWYQVNGETVHRVTLFAEISRLRGIAQQQRMNAENTDRGVIQRLIAKLRRV